jgi:hypothetical protein
MSDSSEDWFGMNRLALACHLRRLADDIERLNPDFDDLVAINSWTLTKRDVPCLTGHPTGHPVIGDGRQARTSELFYFDPEKGIARSFSRWYRLGTRAYPAYRN